MMWLRRIAADSLGVGTARRNDQITIETSHSYLHAVPREWTFRCNNSPRKPATQFSEKRAMNQESAPLVSICMPAYNVERVLASALTSVLGQTYPKTEVILVDDGSTDGTPEVARSFKDERLRYFRNTENLGGYQTMNKAVSLATGGLVAIYHSDDVYEANIVEKEIAYLQAHPGAGAVFCMAHFIDEEGHIWGGSTLPREFQGRDSFVFEDVFPFLVRNKNILFCCPTFMARRQALDAVGPFDAEKYDIVADLDMWIRIARKFPVGILDERLMRYRVGKKQWTSRYNFLRTEPDLAFRVMDHYMQQNGWLDKLSRSDLNEYAFHLCDDETFRASNWVILGDSARARELLRRPYPWSSLIKSFRRRKLRVLLLRLLMRVGLGIGAVRPLGRLLRLTEYSGRR